jgi:hypothetical protein
MLRRDFITRLTGAAAAPELIVSYLTTAASANNYPFALAGRIVLGVLRNDAHSLRFSEAQRRCGHVACPDFQCPFPRFRRMKWMKFLRLHGF